MNLSFYLHSLDSIVWNHVVRLGRSILLDKGHPCLQQGNAHGAGYLSHRDLWPHHAAPGRS